MRTAALRFLETDNLPFEIVASKTGDRSLRAEPAWPLPLPDYLRPLALGGSRRFHRSGPHYDVLLDMAIAAKRPDEVLHWYDKMGSSRNAAAPSDRVAEAVAQSHPQRALEIYRRGLDAHLPHADVASYEASARYLAKMRPILDSLGRKQEWSTLLAEIREKYRNRPRFMEILDRLEKRTVLDSRKAHRRR